MVVCVSAVGTALASVIVVIMSVVGMVMIVGRIGVIVGQKFWIYVQYGVQVETADIHQGGKVGFAEIDGGDGCTWVHAHQSGS